jgi:S-formylglutathione hydrolase FrmB
MIVASFDADASSYYLDSALPQDPNLEGKAPRNGHALDDTTKVKSLFTTFFFDEFIPAIANKYRINTRQQMLTGFSMGGFGAFHFMLLHPAQFVAVSTMSGWFPDADRIKSSEVKTWMTYLLGPYDQNQKSYEQLDLYAGIKAAKNAGTTLPPIYLTCGTEDHLIDNNHEMRDFLKAQGIPCEYKEGPGIHNWKFWRDSSASIIDFHWRTIHPDAK